MISHSSKWIVNKSTYNKCWWGCGEREYVCTVGGKQFGAVTVESSMEILQKIKNGTALWPSNFTSRNLSEETQNTNLKEHKHLYVHCSIIYNHQDLEAAQVSISRWVDKTTVVHLRNGILLGHKKEHFTCCDSMDGPGKHCAK